ncbi:hypothetical protein AXF42_Ash017124 [Apostasia shenzhenica]|uniref:GTD-binding domain-containing protein n=1 Tax=Apostasia shenzhenica TaxID=1088818 RepID=A0A2H9ZV38_9ASPA|nr:hypothetical protein AXF42_Ash017124 [Apostasia shenzhenica]
MPIGPFSLLLLLSFSCPTSDESYCWKSTLRSLPFPHYRVLIDLLLIFSLCFLAVAVRQLSRRCEELVSILQSSSKLRNGMCSEGGDRDSPDKKLNNAGAEEEEEIVPMVAKLREEIVRERRIREEATEQLEQERRAARSAVDEMMMKIMLLQKEKGVVEMEARQIRELAEQKGAYDLELIENLKWIVLRHEVEKMTRIRGIEA